MNKEFLTDYVSKMNETVITTLQMQMNILSIGLNTMISLNEAAYRTTIAVVKKFDENVKKKITSI